ncbi:MAG: hypothetical protein LBC76_06385 [Treponema sp.]|jgi:hypothetical protein|nr:hypothetical protein [Treponema sp.]
MKKLWMVLSALLVIGIGTAGAQVWTANAPANYQLKLPKNQYSPGHQGVVAANWLFNRQQIKVGEKYELEITFKSNRAFTGLDIAIVDGSEKAKWWQELSDWEKIEEAIPANTEITKKFTFTTTTGATGTENRANSIVFDTQGATQEITLTFSKFTLTRVQ